MRPRALTIAGHDPTGGAGVLQDVRTFEVCGVWGLAAVTAVTAQDPARVRAWETVAPSLLRAQVEAAARSAAPRATKTGMLGTPEAVEVVAELVEEAALGPLVLDPVLIASSGDALSVPGLAGRIGDLLLPLATIVTPNVDEAAALTGVEAGDVVGMRRAAGALVEMGARAALVTGGHLTGSDAVDVLLDDAGEWHELRAPRLPGRGDHGTGCVLSAAIAAHLARGSTIEGSVRAAKGVVTRALRNAEPFGSGRGAAHPVAREQPWALAGHPFE